MEVQNSKPDFVLRKNGSKPPEKIKKKIIGHLRGYRSDDDVTLIILKNNSPL